MSEMCGKLPYTEGSCKVERIEVNGIAIRSFLAFFLILSQKKNGHKTRVWFYCGSNRLHYSYILISRQRMSDNLRRGKERAG